MNMAKALTKQGGYGTLERPIYSPGLLLEDEDLTSGVDYTRRLTQLMFSSLFGCGVICGLRVTATYECNGRELKVEVGKGLGLDCLGNPIEVPRPQTLTYDPGCEEFPPAIWVVACHVDKSCAPRELSCSYDGGSDRAMTRRKDGFEIKLYSENPENACSCEPRKDPVPQNTGNCPPATQPVDATPPDRARDGANDDARQEPSCYDDHMKGVCPCGGACSCIVIGKITLPRPDGATMTEPDARDRTAVREIRPFLIGQFLELRRREGPPDDSGNRTGDTSPQPA